MKINWEVRWRLGAIVSVLLAAGRLEAQVEGGGEYKPPPGVCLDEPQRAAIRARLEQNMARLRESGQLLILPTAGTAALGWPIGTSGLSTPGVHGVSNFVDQEPLFPNQVKDYNCGTRTYDTDAGYNHKGTDIFSFPFPWLRMDLQAVIIVAAAPGTIIGKDDGNSDRSCASNSNPWNAVYIQHDDKSVAWYGHMKKGSTTSKAVGTRVAQGDYLGVVGSSGSSTGPHLHLELYDPAGKLTDAYAGACNKFSATSSWTNQRPYYDTAINEIATHSAPPVFPTCPTQETPNYQSNFAPGAVAYFAAYYRDRLAGQVSTSTIFKPDGSVWQTWTNVFANAHFASSYFYRSFTLPVTPEGVWKYRVQFEGQTVDQSFVVGAGAPTVPGPPTTVAATAGDATVSVTFAAPASDGGSAITGYAATCGAKGAVGAGSPITVSGLTNGTPVSCTVIATNVVGNSVPSATSNTVTPSSIPRLVNIATRARVQTGDNVMIAGFIIGGNAPKKVLITARGPSLAVAPFNVPGTLADPFLQLFSGATQTDFNDDYSSRANWTDIPATVRPPNAREAAILTTLSPGAYTAIVTGVGATSGVAIVEVFEIDAPEIPLINIATRSRVETGDNVMIAGFVIQGNASKTVVVTARGPSLAVAPFNVPNTLADPYLRIYSGQTVIYENDNWGTWPTASQIPDTQKPKDPKDAAVLVTLAPGAYTVIVGGGSGSTGSGVAIVEVFVQ